MTALGQLFGLRHACSSQSGQFYLIEVRKTILQWLLLSQLVEVGNKLKSCQFVGQEFFLSLIYLFYL